MLVHDLPEGILDRLNLAAPPCDGHRRVGSGVGLFDLHELPKDVEGRLPRTRVGAGDAGQHAPDPADAGLDMVVVQADEQAGPVDVNGAPAQAAKA